MSVFVWLVLEGLLIVVNTQLQHGVNPEVAKFYEKDSFQCLDQSKTMTSLFVNDDYCDCMDGSDEPGTSACSNGRFYCPNHGSISVILTSSRVMDGLCDCCDGSDEYDTISKTSSCPNYCNVDGEATIKELQYLIQIYEKGLKTRIEFQNNFKEDSATTNRLKQMKIAITQEIERLKERESLLKVEKQNTQAEQDKEIEKKRKAIFENMETKKGKQTTQMKLSNLNKELTQHKKIIDQYTQEIKNLQEQILYHQHELQRLQSLYLDFGPENGFNYLSNQAISFLHEKYKYEITPFKQVKQISSTGEGLSMGKWAGWGENYGSMRFENGDTCWTGPPRSTVVMVSCGEEDKIVEVKEPGMCEYVMKMESPGACTQLEIDKMRARVAFLKGK